MAGKSLSRPVTDEYLEQFGDRYRNMLPFGVVGAERLERGGVVGSLAKRSAYAVVVGDINAELGKAEGTWFPNISALSTVEKVRFASSIFWRLISVDNVGI